MCWSDIIIGKGESRCSATKIFSIGSDHNISHNDISYWISDVFLGIGLTIYKNTKEGIKLSQLIENKTSLIKINQFLSKIVLKNYNPDFLLQKVKESNKYFFEQGKKFKENEIKNVLGIWEN